MKNERIAAPEVWESYGESNRFTRIFESMYTHPSFRSLTRRQRELYFCMKSEYTGSGTRKPMQNPNWFYFNWEHAHDRLKLYTSRKYFYEDIRALTAAGFIEVIDKNKPLRKMTVYGFSDKWYATKK